jgi:hypothetical protein
MGIQFMNVTQPVAVATGLTREQFLEQQDDSEQRHVHFG